MVTAKVVVTVSPTGSLLGAKIYQSTGNMALDQAALSAARQSTYSPKVVNCQPVTGDYLFAMTFDPKAGPTPRFIPGYVPPTSPPALPVQETCDTEAMTASQQFEVLQQRRDYERAFQAANDAARMLMQCATQTKSPERISLAMMAASTLSRAADVAFYVGRYRWARDFATRANAIYSDLLAPALEQNYGRFLTPNAKGNMQANDDLLKRITAQQRCAGDVSAPIKRLVLGEMPNGTTVPSVGVDGNYALAIAFGPGGYAVRTFLLVNHNGWKIRASEGGAFDLSAYRHNGVPAAVAAKLASSVACAG